MADAPAPRYGDSGVRSASVSLVGAVLLWGTLGCFGVGCRENGSTSRGSGSTTSVLVRCARSETEEIVSRFVTAFNHGDLATLDSLVAYEPSFQWYSVSTSPGRRIRDEAENRHSLAAYFASRHRVAERLELNRFQFDNRTFGHGGFRFAMTRFANDLNTQKIIGKGEVNCTLDPPSIVVWSMG
jgi:hypothetical protein